MGYIDFDKKLCNQSESGVTAVNVEKSICEHSFVVYLDNNMEVRDCFITDFLLELPEIEPKRKDTEEKVPGINYIDINLIKINVKALELAYILRACFLKKALLVIKEEDFIVKHLQSFLTYIFQDSFDFEVRIKSSKDYKDNKKKFKNFLIISDDKVLRNKGKILDAKKLKIERNIVQKFYAEYDPQASLIILKNEINKIFELSQEIIEIINNYNGTEKLGKKKLIDLVRKKREIKIPFAYLELLLDILKFYFKFDLSGLSDYYFPALGI
ncbi:MAG: hypothetical protein GF353_13525 [Candidatus Lokiarchaeota archaeon]|nr:hypothetical protein [Candidatus Lokiarchaeota archaeon]